MNISGINYESVVDGKGIRVVVFVSGCMHNCDGCHNPSSHSFDAGVEFTDEFQDSVVKYLQDRSYLSGITISGGDPMYRASEVAGFLKKLKDKIPDISVWLYSGFTYDEILRYKNMVEVLKLCDVLVDGRFILEERDVSLCYRGSKNQRVIDVKKSLEREEVVLFE